MRPPPRTSRKWAPPGAADWRAFPRPRPAAKVIPTDRLKAGCWTIYAKPIGELRLHCRAPAGPRTRPALFAPTLTIQTDRRVGGLLQPDPACGLAAQQRAGAGHDTARQATDLRPVAGLGAALPVPAPARPGRGLPTTQRARCVSGDARRRDRGARDIDVSRASTARAAGAPIVSAIRKDRSPRKG